MKIQGQKPPVNNTPAPAPKPPSEPPAPQDPQNPKDHVGPSQEKSKEMTWSKLALRTAYGAGAGALCGKYIDGNRHTSVTYQVTSNAIGFGVGAGLLGGVLGIFEGHPIRDGAIGLAGGAAVGAGIGYLQGNINYLLNSALPWSPAINGAVLGGGGTLVSGLVQMAYQHSHPSGAETPKKP